MNTVQIEIIEDKSTKSLLIISSHVLEEKLPFHTTFDVSLLV